MSEDIYREVGQRIAELRRKRNLTQTALAQRAGISNSYITTIETGEKRPTLDVLANIAKALDASLPELVGGVPGPPDLTADERELLTAARALPRAGTKVLIHVAQGLREIKSWR